jgi:hypothetical protein
VVGGELPTSKTIPSLFSPAPYSIEQLRELKILTIIMYYFIGGEKRKGDEAGRFKSNVWHMVVAPLFEHIISP